MANPLFKIGMWLTFERWAKKNDYRSIKEQIETNGSVIIERIRSAQDNAKSHWHTTHLVGMERWMQSRIKVALGEAYIEEEYDGYRPPKTATWQEIEQDFLATRRASLDICDQLIGQDVVRTVKVNHNQFGEITVGAWLEYLDYHSKFHAKAIKQK